MTVPYAPLAQHSKKSGTRCARRHARPRCACRHARPRLGSPAHATEARLAGKRDRGVLADTPDRGVLAGTPDRGVLAGTPDRGVFAGTPDLGVLAGSPGLGVLTLAIHFSNINRLTFTIYYANINRPTVRFTTAVALEHHLEDGRLDLGLIDESALEELAICFQQCSHNNLPTSLIRAEAITYKHLRRSTGALPYARGRVRPCAATSLTAFTYPDEFPVAHNLLRILQLFHPRRTRLAESGEFQQFRIKFCEFKELHSSRRGVCVCVLRNAQLPR